MHIEECLQGILMVNILQTWIETRLQYIWSDWFKPIPNVSCRLALIWLSEWMEFMGIMHCTRQIKTSSFSNKGGGRLHTGKPGMVFKALAVQYPSYFCGTEMHIASDPSGNTILQFYFKLRFLIFLKSALSICLFNTIPISLIFFSFPISCILTQFITILWWMPVNTLFTLQSIQKRILSI